MADNTTLNTGAGGDVVATDDIAGVKFQRVKVTLGADGVNDADVSSANPMPIVGAATLGTDLYTEATTKGITIGAVRRDADTTLVDTTNEIAPLQVNSAGQLKVAQILPLPTGDNTIGRVKITDGTDVADIFGSSGSDAEPTTPKPLNTASFSYGYNGATWDRLRSNTINGLDVDVTRLPSLVAGTAYVGKVRLTDGTTDGEVVPLAGYNAQAVAIVDAAGVQITSFAGTPPTEFPTDEPSSPSDKGSIALAVRNDGGTTVLTDTDGDYSAIAVDSKGVLFANILSASGAGLATDATLDAVRIAVETIDNAIAGSEMQVDVVAALPVGTNVIGKVSIDQATPGTTNAVQTIADGVVSTANSSTANLGIGAVFTGTSEDASSFASIQVSIFSSHVSATDGLSLQQSSDGTNWDITDVFTIPATTGKTFSLQVAARFYRLVYTNGGTLTTSLRIQTIFHKNNKKGSSVRPQDARSNENDFEENLSYLMAYNGATWDRVRVVDETGASATDALAVGGGTPHDSVDSGNPVKLGGVAVSGSASPTSVASGDRTRFIANQHGIPYFIGGHPNLITREYDFGTVAQTDVNLAAAVVAADERIYITRLEVLCDNANTVAVSARVGFGAANVPAASATGVSGMIASHPGIAAGSGIICGNGSGIIAVGAAGEEPRITTSAATTGNTHVIISYFLIDETP